MFKIVLLFVSAAAAAGGAVQKYKPAHGETDMKLEIQGRGSVEIKLFTQDAPKTTNQIIKLVKSGFYDGQRFHRVERSPKPYIIQVGDPASKKDPLGPPEMSGGSGTTLPYEDSGHENVEGSVSLAHTMADHNSGDSQFFVNLSANKFLDGSYTVFGQVVSGMDVVNKIERGDRISSAKILVAQ